MLYHLRPISSRDTGIIFDRVMDSMKLAKKLVGTFEDQRRHTEFGAPDRRGDTRGAAADDGHFEI